MTHTLHRQGSAEDLEKDYIVFSMAAQKFNDQGSAQKLNENLKAMLKASPVNYGDDNQGGILTGLSVEEIMNNAGDKAYMAAVYRDRAGLVQALKELVKVDSGMPVVVSGNFKQVFEALREVGLKPHTVHLSLGLHGKVDRLPSPKVLEITTMCGHGMVCPDHVDSLVEKVRKGRMTAKEAGVELARPCTCAMFNPERATDLVTSLCKEKEEIA